MNFSFIANVSILLYLETDFSNKLDIVYVSQRQIAGEEKTKEVTLECFVNGV